MISLSGSSFGRVMLAIALIQMAMILPVQAKSPKTVQEMAPLLKNIANLNKSVLKLYKKSKGYEKATATKINGGDTVVYVFGGSKGKSMTALVPKTFAIANYMPLPKDHPVRKVSIANAVIFLGGTGKSLSVSKLPAPLQKVFKAAGFRTIKPGKNHLAFYASINISKSKDLKKALSALGVSTKLVSLTGRLSMHSFRNQKKLSNSQKSNQYKTAGFTVALPKPKLSGLPSGLKFGALTLGLKGNDKTKKFSFLARTGLTVALAKKKVGFQATLNLGAKAEKGDFTMTARPSKASDIPTVGGIDPKTIRLVLTRAKKKWSGKLTAQGTLNKKTINYSGALEKVPGGKVAYDLVLLTKLTMADLMGGLKVPGLNKIEIDRLEKTDKWMKADLKIHGKAVTAVVFKPKGASKNHVAVLPASFKIADFTPLPSGTPLDKVTFQDMAFLYVPKGQGKTGVSTSGLQADVAKSLAHSGTKVDLKDGLNLFGKADFAASGTVKSLLSALGVTKTNLALNGSLPNDLFSHDPKKATKKIKDRLLDALHLKFPLPALKPKGLPAKVSFTDGHLAIDGIKEGKGGVEVGIDGTLSASLGSKKISFAVTAEAEKTKGSKADFTITGKSTETPTLSFVHAMKLTGGLSFKASRTGGKWSVSIDAKTTLNKKIVDVTVKHTAKGDNYVTINTKLKLSDLLGGAMGHANIDVLEFDSAEIHKTWALAKGKVKGVDAKLGVFRLKGDKKPRFAIMFDDFTPATFIPGTAGTPAEDLDFKDIGIVWQPKGAKKVAASAFPGPIGAFIAPHNTSVNLVGGLNMLGKIEVHPSGKVAEMFKKVGLKTLSFPLSGKAAGEMFHKNVNSASVKSAILKLLDIKVRLPKIAIAELKKDIAFRNSLFVIKGTKTKSGADALDVGFSTDIDLTIKGDKLDFAVDMTMEKSAGELDVTITGKSTKKWKGPLGIPYLTIDKLVIDAKHKSIKGKKEFIIDVKGKTDIGSHTRIDIALDVKRKNNKITEALFTLTGPISADQIPGIRDIPEVNRFTLNSLEISEHGIEADTMFGSSKVSAAFFENPKSGSRAWNLALAVDHLSFDKLIPGLSKTPFKHITLSETAIIFAKAPYQGSTSELSDIGKRTFDRIYGGPQPLIKLRQGLSLFTALELKKTGKLQDAIRRLGMTAERIVIAGDMGGIFGGSPHLDLRVELSASKNPKNAPQFMKKSKKGKGGKKAETFFFISAVETGEDIDVELGIGVGFDVKVHKDNLFFDTRVALEFSEEKIDVKVVGAMEGSWHKPFGIPGLKLSDVTLDLGLDEDGAVHLGFAGSTTIGGDTFSVKADADLLPEALGAPQDIAFVGSADKVSMFMLEAMAFQVLKDSVGKDIHLPINKLPVPEFRKVKLAFVTPGAEDPDLKIYSEGMAMKGTLFWLGKELGDVDIAIGPVNGISADGKIDDITLGPLVLKNNNFDLKVPVRKLPHLKIHADLEFLSIKNRFELIADATELTISAHETLTQDFIADFDLKLTGIDMNKAQVDLKKADFFVKGAFRADIEKFFKDAASGAIDEVFAEMKEKFAQGKEDLKTAEAEVKKLNGQIETMRATVRRERAKADQKIEGARRRVDSLQGELNHDWDRYHHCSGWGKWACRGWWGVRIGGVEGAKRTADAILRAAESTVDHFPLDFDPRIAALIILKDAAVATLHAAEYAIDGLDALDSILARALEEIAKAAAKGLHIDIKEASFEGDLRGMITNDEPVDLTIKAAFYGNNVNETFAFKMNDVAHDMEHLGLMGLYALENLFERGMSGLTSAFKHHAHAVIGRKIDAKEASNKREVAKYNKDFNKYHTEARAIQAAYKAYTDDYVLAQLARSFNALDKEPPSIAYTNEFIETGHTGLCLTNENGQITQHPCSGAKASAQQFTTKPVMENGKNSGYVQIDIGGHCATANGTWNNVDRKFGEHTFSEPEFTSDGKIVMKTCDTEKQFHWKVLKHGTNWVQLANRASQKCIHFADSHAVPGHAKAVWESCHGAANQVFRLASSVTPKYKVANLSLKMDYQNLCLGTSRGNKLPVPLVDCANAPSAGLFDYIVDIRGYMKLVNRRTGRCLQPSRRNLEGAVQEAACTDRDSQWWLPTSGPGGWQIKNVEAGSCFTNTGVAQLMQIACADWSVGKIAVTSQAYEGAFWSGPVSQNRFPPANQITANFAFSQNERMAAYNQFVKRRIPSEMNVLEARKVQIRRTHMVERCTGGDWPERRKCVRVLSQEGEFKIFQLDREIQQKRQSLIAWHMPPPEPQRIVCQANLGDAVYVGMIDGNRICHAAARIANTPAFRPRTGGGLPPAISMPVPGQPPMASMPAPGQPRTGGGLPTGNVPGVLRTDRYRILQRTISLTWSSAGPGALNAYAVASGQVPVNGQLKTTYSCRVISERGETRIGWTLDGNLCNFVDQNRAVAAGTRSILVRDPGSVREFNLSSN